MKKAETVVINLRKIMMVMALFLFTGCIRVKMTTLVMPDGSGKLTFTVGINEALIEKQMKEMFGGKGKVSQSKTTVEPEKLQKSLKGFVAFTKPREIKQGGWLYVSISGYFEEINKIQFLGPESTPGASSPLPLFTFAYSYNGAGGTMVIQSPMMAIAEKGTSQPPASPENLKILEAFLPDDFEWRQEYIVPGEIVEAEGISGVQNRKAVIAIGKKEMMGLLTGMKITPFPAKIRITFQGNQVSSEQVSSFKKELSQAKREWAYLQKKRKKKER